MAITTRVLGSTAGDKSGTSFSVTITAPSAGEFVQVINSYTYDSGFTCTCSGYSLTGDASGVKTQYMPYLQLFTKFAVGNEGTALTISKGSAMKNFAVIVLGSTGVDTGSPFSAGPTPAAGAASGTGTAPSITPATDGETFWVLAHQNYRAQFDNQVSWTGATELAEVDEAFNVASVASQASSPGVASGTRAWALSPWGGNTAACVMAYALREAVAAPPAGPEGGRMLLGAM